MSMKMKHFFLFATFFLFLPLFAAPIALRDGWDDVKTQRLPSQFRWRSDTAGARILQVCNKEAGKGGLVSFPLDLNRYAGKLVEVTALIKAVKVTKPGVGYLGIKFMLPYRSFGIAEYPSATDGLHGTFDYKKFALTVQLPKEVEMANVAFGLQDSTGEVFFRDFKIRIISPEEFQKLPFQLPEDFQCEYSPAVRNRPIARGVMTPDPRVLTAKDIRDLKLWNVTLVRWQFLSNRPGFPDEYQKHLDSSLDKLLALAPEFRDAGIRVVFDMHMPPGGRYKQPAVLGTAGALAELDGSACLRLFMENFYFDLFVNSWGHIAKRLRNCDVIWGYDLLNEPTSGGQQVRYSSLYAQYEAAKAIRKIDPETPIIVESDEWAAPDTFSYLKPLPLKNIFYQFHFYAPGPYTHQGIGEANRRKVRNGNTLAYPSHMGGEKMVDKSALAKMMLPVRIFQQKYHAMLFCGEFSAIRWAPGAAQYINDVASLLEELNCSWTYHAYREWQGWSVEHDENIDNENRVDYDTDRKKVLLKYFEKNRK